MTGSDPSADEGTALWTSQWTWIWWIESLDAVRAEDLPAGRRHVVLSGISRWAVKDPVITHDENGWRMWVCCHPLTEGGHEDRMVTS